MTALLIKHSVVQTLKKQALVSKVGFFKKKEVHYFELAHLFEANIPTLIPGG